MVSSGTDGYMYTERLERAGASLDFLLGFTILIATWAYSIASINTLTGQGTIMSCTATLTGLQVLSLLTDSPGVPENWEKSGDEKVYGLHDSKKPGNVLDPAKIDSFFYSAESDKKAFLQFTSGKKLNISLRKAGEVTIRSTGPPVPDDFLPEKRIVSIPSKGYGTVDAARFSGDSPSPDFRINLTRVMKENSPSLKTGDKVILGGMVFARTDPNNAVDVLNVTYCQSGVCNPVNATNGDTIVQAGVPFLAWDNITLTIPDNTQFENGEFHLDFAKGSSKLYGTAYIEEYIESYAILSVAVW